MRFLVALLLIPSLAIAQTAPTSYIYDTTTTNTSSNTNTSTSTATNTNNNTNVNTSTSTATNYNVQSGSMTNTNVNTNVNTSTSTDTSTVSQTVNSTAETSNRNVNDNNSDSNIRQHVVAPPPTAAAPTIMNYSQDVCTSGISGAVQTQIVGLSVGKSVRDMNCERLKLSKTMFDMGMKVAAVSLLCQDDRVFSAMLMAGTPCPYEGKIGEEAKAAWAAKKPEK